MDITQIYAITMAGLLFILLLARVLFHRIRVLYKLWLLFMKVLFYSNLISRHRLLGPWRNVDVTTQLIYIAINAFCFSFRLASTPQAGLRAARLSLINMILLFLGPHFSFLASRDRVGFRVWRNLVSALARRAWYCPTQGIQDPECWWEPSLASVRFSTIAASSGRTIFNRRANMLRMWSA